MMYAMIMEEFVLEKLKGVDVNDVEELFDLEISVTGQINAYRLMMYAPEHKDRAKIYLLAHLAAVSDLEHVRRHIQDISSLLDQLEFLPITQLQEELRLLFVQLSVLKTLIEMSSVDAHKTEMQSWKEKEYLENFFEQMMPNLPEDLGLLVNEYFSKISLEDLEILDVEIQMLSELSYNEIHHMVGMLEDLKGLSMDAKSRVTSNLPMSFEDKEKYFLEQLKMHKFIILDHFRREVCVFFPVIVRSNEYILSDIFDQINASDEEIDLLKQHFETIYVHGVKVLGEVYDADSLRFTWNPQIPRSASSKENLLS